MIVTIDGPAGAGKSSVAKELAERLGFQFLDTGAMYRAVAWAGLESKIDMADVNAMAELAARLRIGCEGDTILVDGKNVTEAIRTVDVTENVQFAAANVEVREVLVEQQRQIGRDADNLVTEGRDQGTVVFPQAECKIYLTATPEERARRRHVQLQEKGEELSLDEVLRQQNQRDDRDASRSVAPMAKPQDAIEVYTDAMTQEQVVNHLIWLVRSSQPRGPHPSP